ncbi:hypothetical protein [Nostoc sp.]|uniref:hypothetical protein n=1 Tax=Nostoc sp. TaxID=1180 RepID=UPI002FFAEF3F
MKISVSACFIPVFVCTLMNYYNPGTPSIPLLPCPGNIVIEWQEKEKKGNLKKK